MATLKLLHLMDDILHQFCVDYMVCIYLLYIYVYTLIFMRTQTTAKLETFGVKIFLVR